MLKSFANAIAHYHDGSMPYIKLLDGGLVDNFGLSGLHRRAAVLEHALRSAHAAPGGEASPRAHARGRCRPRAVRQLDADRRRAVRARACGRGRRHRHGGERARELHRLRPHHVGMAGDTGALALRPFGGRARAARRRARLELPRREVLRRTRSGFDQLGPERAAALDAVPTSFRLPPETVDAVIAAGRESLRANPTYAAFLKSL